MLKSIDRLCVRVRAPHYARAKRALDLLLASGAVLALAPLFCGVALAVRLTSRGPVLFRQVRMGRGLSPFLLYKFRTMTVDAPRECPTAAFADRAAYLTPIGRVLRATSLDELPQLLNVLRGEMSLLGPRPVALTEGELIEARAAAGVYRVRPGLSGAAQLGGRDLLSDREKLALDRAYVEGLCFSGDVRLFFSTFSSVLLRRGVAEAGRASIKKRKEVAPYV